MNHYFDIYTDGACSGNPGPGGLSAVLINKSGDIIAKVNKGFVRTTNNRMEILAVAYGLDTLKEKIQSMPDMNLSNVNITVYSDSQLVVNTCNLGWAKNSNNDCWRALDKAKSLFGKVTFVKVKGHDTNKFNNEADRLAVEASKASEKAVDEAYENKDKEEQTLFGEQKPDYSEVLSRLNRERNNLELIRAAMPEEFKGHVKEVISSIDSILNECLDKYN